MAAERVPPQRPASRGVIASSPGWSQSCKRLKYMDNLSKYLNDHLAGSVAALELLDHLGHALKESPRLAAVLDSLRGEIEADQHVLKDLIESVAAESPVRKIFGWIGEKASRLKFVISGEKPGALGLVEALELLTMGILGKQLLWGALQEAGLRIPPRFDLEALKSRAAHQFQRMDDVRLEAARLAFAEHALTRR